jgi:hypothetical protein
LGLSNGQLGLALFGMALGTLIGGRLGGVLASRFGAWNVVRVGIPAFGGMLWVAALTTSLAALTLILLLFGTLASTVDVSMNAEGAVVERRSSRPLMSGFHAGWSLGLLTGALVGVAAAGAGIRPSFQFGVVAILVATASAPVLGRVPERVSGERTTNSTGGGWSLQLALLGLIVFSSFFAEGAAADWSAVFVRDTVGAGAALAASAFACFSLGMIGARLLGDRLAAAAGPVRLVAVSALTASVGLAAALLAPSAVTGIVGFGLLGIGLGPVVPTAVSAATGAGMGAVEQVVSRVFTIGYFGGVAGPAVIGFTSSQISLRAALLIPLCLVIFIAASSGRLATALGSASRGFG